MVFVLHPSDHHSVPDGVFFYSPISLQYLCLHIVACLEQAVRESGFHQLVVRAAVLSHVEWYRAQPVEGHKAHGVLLWQQDGIVKMRYCEASEASERRIIVSRDAQ